MRVVLTVPGMDAVSARRDLPYKTGDGTGAKPLCMDVYSPPGPQRDRPAVILVHGGPIPMLGARRMGVFVSYGELLAACGFVGVAFDHRFLAPDRLPDAAGDVADLTTHVRANHALGEDARSAPPVLVARAGLDNPWLNGGADRFVQAAMARGATLDLLNHPEGRHGFDILDDDARSKQIIRRTLEFLRDHLAP